MKYFLSKTKLLKTVHVEWINQELDEAVYDNYLNYEQKMRISWVYGRINKRIPGFASNEDIISDYGALPPGSKVDIPSFVIHVIDQGSYALVHRAYTQKWEQNVQGALKMVILIEWAYLHKKLLQGQLEVLEYDKLKGCLVSKQRETLLPWQVNRWPVIYVKQSILLGDHVPNPDREIGLKVGYLVDDAIEHISSEGLGCAAGYCKPSCNHEPIAESELGDLADHDINADHLALDTALRTAVAAAPVSSIISNANNQSNSNNITDSHDTTTINITFQTINPREYDTPKTPAEFLTFFNNTIEDLKVRGATNTAEIVKLANLCAEKIGSACAILGLPQAKATNDLATVSLYTSIVFCDDSGSMRLSTRYKLLQETINRLAPITTALNNTGISLRFINHRRNIASFNDLRTSDEIAAQLQNLHLRGSTPIGTELRAKVLEPFLLQKARDGTLDRPVLITIITDGEPAGESRGTLKKVILDTKIALQSLKNRDGEVYGDRAVIFQINYVGSSAESQDYIAELDRDPDVGHLIFCNKEKIDDTMQRLESDAARNEWMLRLLKGAIVQQAAAPQTSPVTTPAADAPEYGSID